MFWWFKYKEEEYVKDLDHYRLAILCVKCKRLNYNSYNWKLPFLLVCKKCGSSKVEYNNTIEVGRGYYNDIEKDGSLVVKCHDCGNAFKIDADDMTN